MIEQKYIIHQNQSLLEALTQINALQQGPLVLFVVDDVCPLKPAAGASGKAFRRARQKLAVIMGQCDRRTARPAPDAVCPSAAEVHAFHECLLLVQTDHKTFLERTLFGQTDGHCFSVAGEIYPGIRAQHPGGAHMPQFTALAQRV